MLGASAHTDTFSRDNLPDIEKQPDFLLDQFDYPEFINVGYELTGAMVDKGFADHTALIGNGRRRTYKELADWTNRLAHVLVDDFNVQPGNRILIRSANNPAMVACWLAATKVGAVVINTMPMLRAAELSQIVDKAKVTLALCDTRLLEELELCVQSSSTLQHVVTFDGSANHDSELDKLALEKPVKFTSVKTGRDDVALLGFTSGTTGEPKATMHFHRDLGFNVLHPVFPSHGPRSSGVSGEEVLTLDYLNNVHAVSQAVWDVRQLLDWAREDDQPIAIHGVSMGGYLAALLAGLAPDLHTVITGVPTVDMAWVMQRHTPDEERVALDERSLIGERAQKIHSVISPLAFTPNVPVERRFVYAGVADRMATPGQAYRLWTHWDEPSVLWYRGAHVSFAWSREVRRFVDRSLRGMSSSPVPDARVRSTKEES